jgi:hypothetical protein
VSGKEEKEKVEIRKIPGKADTLENCNAESGEREES